MACFLVPAAEAVVTTIAAKVIKSKETEKTVRLTTPDGAIEEVTKTPFSTKLGWLNKLLWGGSALLAFEHVWHGEVVPYFPFLTAMSDPADKAEMLHEMSTVGVSMAALITVAWVGMLAVSAIIEKRSLRTAAPEKEAAK